MQVTKEALATTFVNEDVSCVPVTGYVVSLLS
jgi:hypothetical protein